MTDRRKPGPIFGRAFTGEPVHTSTAAGAACPPERSAYMDARRRTLARRGRFPGYDPVRARSLFNEVRRLLNGDDRSCWDSFFLGATRNAARDAAAAEAHELAQLQRRAAILQAQKEICDVLTSFNVPCEFAPEAEGTSN